jgi:hypothetical protein
MILMSLWLPILLSAVAVFIASSIIHMALKYHNSDFARLPDEEGVRAALRPFKIPPGEYSMPHCHDQAEMKDPAYLEKLNEGPVGFLNILPNGPFQMGPQLVQWFLFCILVSIFCGYIVGGLAGAGAEYRVVFRYVSATAFASYALGVIPGSIWFKRSWSSTAKTLLDSLIYGLLTGGFFGWLWP